MKQLENWCALPTPMGEFRMYDTGDESVRLICLGDPYQQGNAPLLRLHSSCLASEVFGALDCDCAEQLREGMKQIALEGRGLIVHFHQEGRGQGLSLKIRAVRAMQRDALDTVEAFESLGLEQDIRSYQPAINMLRELGIEQVRLITNNPRKIAYLEEGGIQVKAVSTHPKIRAENVDYLHSKNNKLGHRLPLTTPVAATGAIHFYHSDQSWGDLSNFSAHAIYLQNRIWPTVEHYYQAQKFGGTFLQETIRQCLTPMAAKRTAYSAGALAVIPGWEHRKELVMLEALRAKFGQHPDLSARLLSSGQSQLVEHTELDAYWGDGGDGSGRNRLGVLLMQVREELRQGAVQASRVS